ncbi:MAG: 1,4-beta-xylanase [Hyphomicrobiales bacterium]|nr:MAG: 1,4-beta-xylanase [Hyphomicrobiales bacterium]
MVPVKRRRFLQTLAVASIGPWLSACAGEDRQAGEPFEEEDETQSLAQAAAASGRGFGAAVNAGTLRTRSHGYRAVLGQCSSVTPEWSLKWDRLCPRPGRYDFHEADRIADFARGQGKRMRGHTLLWHLGMPRWADALLADTREWGHVRSYFHTVMPRYADVVDEWDVVNEPVGTGIHADGLRGNQFLQAFGPDYIDWAFWTAREAAPRARLFINEYGLEYALPEEGRRRLALLRLTEGLLRRGVPVHGVGLQAHLDLRKGKIYADGVYGLLRDLSNFGLRISITELDVREGDRKMPLKARDAAVADEVRRYLDIALDFAAVRSISTWGLSDGDSWLAYKADGRADNRGLPYDREWRRKPMRTAIETALRGSRRYS